MPARRLNPFVFRAFDNRWRVIISQVWMGLNPFVFRAFDNQHEDFQGGIPDRVLIPLFSGHSIILTFDVLPGADEVLIPLFSGHSIIEPHDYKSVVLES